MEQKNTKLKYGAGGLALGLLLVFGFLGMFGGGNSDAGYGVTDGETINYKANVCVTHSDETGNVLSSECDHNVLYTTGANLIRTYLGDTGGGTDEIDQISLCNATAGCGTPVAGASEDFTAYTDCGLAEATGTYSAGGDGVWSLVNTFTASCDNLATNSTRLKNTAGTNFAGNSFSSVTLQTNDQLTINWTITVS